MIKPGNLTVILLATVLLSACGSAAVKPQYAFPSQRTGLAPSHASKSRLVIYNDSNMLLHGMDQTGKINVTLDGKGVGRLFMGEFLVIEVKKGRHRLNLEHTDVVSFKSSHSFNAAGRETFLRVSATITSNSASVVAKPAKFASNFDQAYPGKDDF